MNEKWVTFKFDGNQAWGIIRSEADWLEKIVRPYEKASSSEDLLKARQGPHSPGDCPLFGFMVYCRGITLEEWAKVQGMSLPLKSS